MYVCISGGSEIFHLKNLQIGKEKVKKKKKRKENKGISFHACHGQHVQFVHPSIHNDSSPVVY